MTRNRWILVLALGALLLAAALVGWWRFGRALPVDTVRLAEGSVAVHVVGPGNVQARVPITIAARLTAVVTAVQVDVGDTVRAGQLLTVLDDRDLTARRAAIASQRVSLERTIDAAQAGVAKAQAEHALARSRQQRDAELQARGFVSEAGLDGTRTALQAAEAAELGALATLAARRSDLATLAHELRAAEVSVSHTRLTAPIDAVVVQRLVEPGSTVMPGSALLKLVDPRSLWVAMRVDESMLARIQPGQSAQIRLRTGASMSGHVVRIARQSDAATREVDVHVGFDAPPVSFVIDQEAEVRIDTGSVRGPRLPVSTLIRDRDGRQGVLVIDGGRARFMAVRSGVTDGQHLLVEGDLPLGVEVIASATGVRDGHRVQSNSAD